MAEKRASIELTYATAKRQVLLELTVAVGQTVGQVIDESGIYEAFPNQGLETADVGVWGHAVERSHAVCDGDRIEIYRPLPMDPRESRRLLAETGRTMNQARDD